MEKFMSLNTELSVPSRSLDDGGSQADAPAGITPTTSNVASSPVTENDERKDFFIERDGERFAGTHLIIELVGAKHLDNLEIIEAALRKCVAVSKATLLHLHLHHFTPNNGVSGVAVLAESHISIHTWPEANYAALDVFMCGDAEPLNSIAVLKEAFEADQVIVDELRRGRGLV